MNTILFFGVVGVEREKKKVQHLILLFYTRNSYTKHTNTNGFLRECEFLLYLVRLGDDKLKYINILFIFFVDIQPKKN